MSYIDFEITQVGKTLTSEKIKINKYDNNISRLVFNFDGTIPDGRKYCAMKNPITGTYFFLPITNNHVVIGTNITLYVGRWDLILVVIPDDYNLDEVEDIDNTRMTYISDTLSKIIVADNFLNDVVEAVSYPAIDEALDDFAQARVTLENYVIQSGGDAASCASILAQCQDILEQCQAILAEIKG